MSTCEFCKTEFNTKSTLKNHLRTAKYCIQNRTSETFAKELVIFDCKYCSKILSSKQNLNIHFQICIPRYEKMLKEMTETNNYLKYNRTKLFTILRKIIGRATLSLSVIISS